MDNGEREVKTELKIAATEGKKKYVQTDGGGGAKGRKREEQLEKKQEGDILDTLLLYRYVALTALTGKNAENRERRSGRRGGQCRPSRATSCCSRPARYIFVVDMSCGLLIYFVIPSRRVRIADFQIPSRKLSGKFSNASLRRDLPSRIYYLLLSDFHLLEELKKHLSSTEKGKKRE